MADSRIATVLAADDRFSRPLAATVRSIVARLSPGRGLDLYLCDMGITPQNREKIAVAAAHPEVRLHWVETLADEVGYLPQASPGISRATYARLFIPRVLPDDLSRALYLDCDLIVRRCVGEFFDLPMGDLAALGVADAGSPYVSSLYGVPYWSRNGRRAGDVNFNAGVLLLNLQAWREDDIPTAAVKYLTDGRHQFLADQEAINAVLPGRIGQVDPRWNVQTEHFQPPHQATLPLGRGTARRARQGPVDRALHHRGEGVELRVHAPVPRRVVRQPRPDPVPGMAPLPQRLPGRPGAQARPARERPAAAAVGLGRSPPARPAPAPAPAPATNHRRRGPGSSYGDHSGSSCTGPVPA